MMTRTVDVPVNTETGQTCIVQFTHDHSDDTYTLAIAGEIFDASPEALTAAVQMAVLAIRADRARAHATGVQPA